ncbi:predicted protein [Tiamatvirus PSSP7]|uniref:T7-like internal core protein n=2 Tax=Prochlorococcus phage P-SSP7 TaxID=268748 RepID=Q58N25_BPPRP|nr:T7-like internal core protein [Prochlorococcus phage P-SSP7]AAX44213.1 T7-like internal core protein [Prochlorococcus phage P-SSP7]ACY76237.1 predicted protein [Tiamatvirus PSSP7]
MTNSFFNFTEAPDFAAAIGATYESVNTSYDRREELEQKNDAVRLKNAETLEKLPEEIIKTLPTVKKAVDAINKKRREALLAKGYEGIDQELIDKDKESLNTLFNIGKAENFIKNEALKNGDNVTYETIDLSGPHGTRRRLLMIEEIKQRLATEFNPWVTKNYPAGFNTVQEARLAFDKYKQGILNNADELGFNLRFTKSQLKDSFNTVESTFYETTNTAITSKNVLKEQSRMISEVTHALNAEDPLKAFIEASEYNIGYFEGNIAKAERAFINIGLMGTKKGSINIDKFESVLFGEVTAKGDKTRILIDKLGGGEENRLWAEGVLNEIENAKKGVFENKELNRTNYAKGFVEGIQEEENKTNTRMTKVELARYVTENWDITQGGSNLPEFVKNRFAKETGDDILIKAELDYKLDKGIPITEKEVLKLSDPFVEAQYLAKVKTGNPLAPSSDFKALAKSQIKGYATVHAKQAGVAPGKESPQWNNIVENAEREYPLLFAKYMQTADSAVDAHILALKDLESRTNNGVYDNLVVNTDKNKIRSVELIKAEEHIKTIDPNVINTGLIFGTEEVIKEAAELPTGQTHLFYDQLAAKIPGVTGAEIQYKQVEIYNKMNKLEKPVKSDVLLAYEKLSPTVQFYLSHHPSPAKVARAKIEAFKDDAQIDFDEIDFLLPAAKEALEKTIEDEGASFILNELDTEEFLELDTEAQELIMPTPQLGEYNRAEPVEGNWQKIPNQIGYYVYKNGEWQKSGQRGKNKLEYKDLIDGYRDIDGYFKPTFKADPSNPNLGAWKKIPNAIGYFVWDGKEWVRSGQKGKGEEFEGDIENFRDINLDETIKKVN